jgi:DNA repair protein RadD
MSAPKLWTHQEHGARDIMRAFVTTRRVLYVLPVGGGKSRVAAEVIRALKSGCRALVMAHRIELRVQMQKALRAAGVPVGNVQFMSPLKARRLSDVKLHEVDIVVVDEAHRAGGDVYRALLKRMPEARVLGLTASPYRKEGLREDFDVMIEGPSVESLCEAGHIARPVYWSVVESDEPDLKGVAVTGGDYAPVALERATNKPHLVGNIVREWQARASDRSTLVFACGVKHAKSIAAKFKEAGVKARVVTGKTPAAKRAETIRDFDAGKFPVLVNALLLVEGIDIHRIDCLILARATRSRVLFVQALGRAMRPSPTGLAPLVHDHAGAWRWHGLPTTPREWTLDAAPKGESKPGPSAKRCPECGNVCALSAQECSACGASFRRVDEERALQEVASCGCGGPVSTGSSTGRCWDCYNADRRAAAAAILTTPDACTGCGEPLSMKPGTRNFRKRTGSTECNWCANGSSRIPTDAPRVCSMCHSKLSRFKRIDCAARGSTACRSCVSKSDRLNGVAACCSSCGTALAMSKSSIHKRKRSGGSKCRKCAVQSAFEAMSPEQIRVRMSKAVKGRARFYEDPANAASIRASSRRGAKAGHAARMSTSTSEARSEAARLSWATRRANQEAQS